jgi:hypothetical protein
MDDHECSERKQSMAALQSDEILYTLIFSFISTTISAHRSLLRFSILTMGVDLRKSPDSFLRHILNSSLYSSWIQTFSSELFFQTLVIYLLR